MSTECYMFERKYQQINDHSLLLYTDTKILHRSNPYFLFSTHITLTLRSNYFEQSKTLENSLSKTSHLYFLIVNIEEYTFSD